MGSQHDTDRRVDEAPVGGGFRRWVSRAALSFALIAGISIAWGTVASAAEQPAPSSSSSSTQGPTGLVEGVLGPQSDLGKLLVTVGSVDTSGTVAQTVQGTTQLVAGTVDPITAPLQPVTDPVTQAVAPVTGAVVGTVQPVTGAIVLTVRPIVGAVEQVIDPVTGTVISIIDPVTGAQTPADPTTGIDGSKDGRGTVQLPSTSSDLGRAVSNADRSFPSTTGAGQSDSFGLAEATTSCSAAASGTGSIGGQALASSLEAAPNASPIGPWGDGPRPIPASPTLATGSGEGGSSTPQWMPEGVVASTTPPCGLGAMTSVPTSGSRPLGLPRPEPDVAPD
jgi:hypothetical protein